MRGVPGSGRADNGGYALLATVWVLFGAFSIALSVAAVGRTALASSENRVRLDQAAWTARGCLNEMRFRLDSAAAAWATDEAEGAPLGVAARDRPASTAAILLGLVFLELGTSR